MHNNYKVTTTNKGKKGTKQIVALSKEHAKKFVAKKHPKLIIEKVEFFDNSFNI